jgi:hypothetical protein
MALVDSHNCRLSEKTSYGDRYRADIICCIFLDLSFNLHNISHVKASPGRDFMVCFVFLILLVSSSRLTIVCVPCLDYTVAWEFDSMQLDSVTKSPLVMTFGMYQSSVLRSLSTDNFFNYTLLSCLRWESWCLWSVLATSEWYHIVTEPLIELFLLGLFLFDSLKFATQTSLSGGFQSYNDRFCSSAIELFAHLVFLHCISFLEHDYSLNVQYFVLMLCTLVATISFACLSRVLMAMGEQRCFCVCGTY